MFKFLQALPALLAAVVLLGLAVALYLPREMLPAFFRERIAELQQPVVRDPRLDDPSAIAPASATSRPIETLSTAVDSQTAITTPNVAPVRPELRTRPSTPAELMNCDFTSLPEQPTAVPRAVDVTLPEFPGRHAVWGGTGRDLQGRVWIGGCAESNQRPSARLFCYDTQTGEMADVGDVVSALRDHGLLRDGEQQAKIHSKIIQAGDGHLYFTSMDEAGENPDGSELPTWGGHLWRLRLPERKWEHLHAAPEALIAVAGMGRYIYALGYFPHVIYQYDTETRAIATATVASVDGHVSRNLLADLRGHVFMPRLTRDAETKQYRAALVEFDAALKELGETELTDYLVGNPAHAHGITGIQPLADGSLAFVTHRGRLYRISPAEQGPAEIKDLGWMHPLGAATVESLFSYDGKSWLMAVAQLPAGDYEWVMFDLKTAATQAHPLDVPVRYAGVKQGLLLYGSMTRDVEGAFYIVGTSMQAEPYGPVIWRMMPPR